MKSFSSEERSSFLATPCPKCKVPGEIINWSNLMTYGDDEPSFAPTMMCTNRDCENYTSGVPSRQSVYTMDDE